MLTRRDVRLKIQQHLEGQITLEDLAAWAETMFRDHPFESHGAEQIQEALAVIRDAVDPHRFRWEEPDFDQLLEALDDSV
jgi:hypothetical protein